MVPAPGGISYRLGITRSSFCVSGIYDVAQYALPHELLDSGRSLVSPLSSVGDLLPGFMVEVPAIYQARYDEIHCVVDCSAEHYCERPGRSYLGCMPAANTARNA